MAHANAKIGHGSLIKFATGATTNVSNSFFANIIDFDWSGIARAAIDSTHMATSGAKTFLPGGTYDPGGMSATLQFNTGTAHTNNNITTLMTTTITSTAATDYNCTMQFGTATYIANGFVTDLGVSAGDEDVITQAVTLKFTGAIITAVTTVLT